MKKLNLNLFLVSFLVILSSTGLRAQIDPLGDVFLTSQPIWSHVAIDSSAIGYKGRTGMDYYIHLSENKILTDQNYAYLVYNNVFENQSGSFIEKVDLKTGLSLWSNFIDLRNSNKREYTKRFLINEDGDLELLNLRHSFDTLIPGINDWLTGKLAIHKYDTATGNEKYVSYSPIYDTSYLEFSLDYKASLNKNKNHGYDCYTNWYSPTKNSFGMSRIKMDSLGKFIEIDASVEFMKKYIYGYTFEDVPVFLNDDYDTIVRVAHSFQNYPYISGDSLELILHFFNSDLDKLTKYDIASKVTKVKEYQILPYSKTFISILSTEYFQDNSAPRRRIITINPNGKLVEEIYFQNRSLEKFGECDGALKLRNEAGTLIISKNKKKDSPSQFNFYKSDGKGNMQLVLEVPLKNTYNIYNAKLEQLENGNILLSGLYRRRDADPRIDLYPTERFITTLWDTKQLQLVTSSEKIPHESLKIVIIPNPAHDYIQINGLDASPVNCYIYDDFGNVIMQKEIFHLDPKISIRQLIPGKYYVELIDKQNQLLYTGKLLKAY